MYELPLKNLENSFSYPEFLALLDGLVQKKSTTGETTKDRVNFTKLNYKRIQRLNKRIELSLAQKEIFQSIETKQTWLVILESWCADGAQTIPILNKIAGASNNIDLRIILRDENSELMDLFLTNGTRSIPKLIALDDNLEVMSTWGPRSKPAAQMVEDYKRDFKKIDFNFKAKLQVWYNKDLGNSIINELAEMVQNLEKGSLV